MLENLPNPRLRTRWVEASRLPQNVRKLAEKELERATTSAGWHPKVIKVRRDMHIIDVCADSDGSLHSANIAMVRDHPHLEYLTRLGGVPRAVRSIYRKEARVAHERATEAWVVMEAMDAAESAWWLWNQHRWGEHNQA